MKKINLIRYCLILVFLVGCGSHINVNVLKDQLEKEVVENVPVPQQSSSEKQPPYFIFSLENPIILSEAEYTSGLQLSFLDNSLSADFNQDGILDFIVNSEDNEGVILVYSGHDFSLLYKISAPMGHEDFARTDFKILEDINGDGIKDILVGSEMPASINENLMAFSGADGSIIWTVTKDHIWFSFIHRAYVTEDLDGDGVKDILATSFAHYGYIGAISGASGQVLWEHKGSFSLSILPGYFINDYNNDGVLDIALDDSGSSSKSSKVISGSDGTILLNCAGLRGNSFGFHALGDVNSDGQIDYITRHSSENWVKVFSGVDCSILYTININDPMGPYLISDIDKDGLRDFVINSGSFSNSRGAAFIYSGVNGNSIFQITGSFEGASLSFIGTIKDLEGDGEDEYLVKEKKSLGASEYRFFIYSSKTRSLLFTFEDECQTRIFASYDLNLDGVRDIVCQNSKYQNNTGMVSFISGANGNLLGSKVGEAEGNMFGQIVNVVKKKSDDGHYILVSGNASVNNHGKIYIYSSDEI